MKLLVNICYSSCISPYSSWGPGPASCPDGHHRSNGNSLECLDTPLHTHPPHTHPHLTSDRAGFGDRSEGEMAVMSYRESESSRVPSVDMNFQRWKKKNISSISMKKHQMYFLSRNQGMKTTLESSGFWSDWVVSPCSIYNLKRPWKGWLFILRGDTLGL